MEFCEPFWGCTPAYDERMALLLQTPKYWMNAKTMQPEFRDDNVFARKKSPPPWFLSSASAHYFMDFIFSIATLVFSGHDSLEMFGNQSLFVNKYSLHVQKISKRKHGRNLESDDINRLVLVGRQLWVHGAVCDEAYAKKIQGLPFTLGFLCEFLVSFFGVVFRLLIWFGVFLFCLIF